MGYDIAPQFSPKGDLTWLQMKRDGYEADKNDIILRWKGEANINLTASWDGSVESFKWSPDGNKIYFIAAFDGTLQLFEIDLKNIAIPTLVIIGRKDIISIGHAKQMAGLLPHGFLEVIPGGHSLPVTHSNLVNAAIAKFLEIHVSVL